MPVRTSTRSSCTTFTPSGTPSVTPYKTARRTGRPTSQKRRGDPWIYHVLPPTTTMTTTAGTDSTVGTGHLSDPGRVSVSSISPEEVEVGGPYLSCTPRWILFCPRSVGGTFREGTPGPVRIDQEGRKVWRSEIQRPPKNRPTPQDGISPRGERTTLSTFCPLSLHQISDLWTQVQGRDS